MGHGPRYRVAFRRRREGKTDYRRRLALLKSGETRVVVRRTLKNVLVQFVTYDEVGDKVVAQAEARELPALGWAGFTSNSPAAYLTGVLAAKRAKEAGVSDGILDIGMQMPHRGGNLFAALQGVLDGGVQVPHNPEVLPVEERLSGVHVKNTGDVGAVFEKITGKARTPKAAPKKKGGDKGKGAPAAPAKGGDKGKAAGGKPAGEKGAAPDKAAKTSKKGAE